MKSVEVVVYSPDSEQLASGSWDRTAIIWNVEVSYFPLWNRKYNELYTSFCFCFLWIYRYEEFEDTQWVIRICKLKDTTKWTKEKRIKNDLQNTRQKTKDRATW